MLTFSTSYICQNQAIEFNGGQLSPQTITDWNWNFNDPASGIDNVAVGQNTQHVFRSEEHTSELQSRPHLVCRLLLEKKKTITNMARSRPESDPVRRCTFALPISCSPSVSAMPRVASPFSSR